MPMDYYLFIALLVWGIPSTFFRSKFRKIVYQTDDWKINIKPIFIKELKGLFLNIFPENDLIINRVKAKLECIENCKINFVNLYKPFLSILSIHFWKLSKRIL